MSTNWTIEPAEANPEGFCIRTIEGLLQDFYGDDLTVDKNVAETIILGVNSL